MKLMKAIVYEKYGEPNVLQVKEVEKPTPKDDEVRVKIHAAEATKADCELRSFNFPVKWFWLPLRLAMGWAKPKRQILGGYFAGEIEAIGKDVTKFKVGDQVFGSSQLRLGAYGEYLCLPDTYTIVPKPDNITFTEAAAVPLGGLNALHFLRKANISPGEKVLVNGAGGSIGTFGVQIAKAMGAEVTAVDSTIKEKMLRQIGADHFFDYTQEDFTQSSQTYDVILDMVAKSSYTKCIQALKPQGRYLLANPRLSDMFRALLTSKLTDKTAVFAFAGETEEELLALKQMIEAGQIKAAVDQIYPLEQAPEAHQRVETEQRLGIVVLSLKP
ncbi:NAD(P)-dependent alcohol dehydrogenase [Acaryochloris sp. IP29b_bin.137]|uniref:NAD(P)-dependent alcohol dehydrogenase n=1 Tax=Acaryochloris sp. IP29b_bin.137 TaxID=2969217 RepID=UPI0026249812|nr:NAD(P)-dependent alcohol dehydrogenase [Acaryochloris sp. IP29b_bin.137]